MFCFTEQIQRSTEGHKRGKCSVIYFYIFGSLFFCFYLFVCFHWRVEHTLFFKGALQYSKASLGISLSFSLWLNFSKCENKMRLCKQFTDNKYTALFLSPCNSRIHGSKHKITCSEIKFKIWYWMYLCYSFIFLC